MCVWTVPRIRTQQKRVTAGCIAYETPDSQECVESRVHNVLLTNIEQRHKKLQEMSLTCILRQSCVYSYKTPCHRASELHRDESDRSLQASHPVQNIEEVIS